MILPSRAGGRLTNTVGFVESHADAVATWLTGALGEDWEQGPASWTSFDEVVTELTPVPGLSRYAVVPMPSDRWSLLLNNATRGTDVGVVPSLAARQLECRGIRAVCVEDDEPGYPARILEVFGPDGEPPLLSRRSIAAANDGGKWVFETTGEPYPFERVEEYEQRRKADRFTCRMLYDYLRELGVPIDDEPDWAGAFLVARD